MSEPSSNDELALEVERLRRENEQLLEFLYLVPVGLSQLDQRGDVTLASSAAAQLLMPLAERADLTNLFEILDLYAPELRNAVRLHASSHGPIVEGRRIDLRALGQMRGPAVLSVGLTKIDADRIMAIVQDVSRIVEQERAIFADQQRFRAIYEGMRDTMICTLDQEDRIDTWNASGERLLGFSSDDVVGKPLDNFVATGESKSFRRARDPRIAGWTEIEGWTQRKDRTRFWGEGVVSVLHNEEGAVRGFAVVLRDMTERKLAADRLVELATKDALTGLSNRRVFYEVAENEITRRLRYPAPLSLLMIDADRFKAINDGHGHPAGDEVLRHLASVLRAQLRRTDLAARFGGEEFVVLLPGTNAQGALVLAERIRNAVASTPVTFEERSIPYTVSIGIGEAAKDADLKTVLGAADRAVYRAKSEGRNRTVVDQEG